MTYTGPPPKPGPSCRFCHQRDRKICGAPGCPTPTAAANARATSAVAAWSEKIHGPTSPRHIWCKEAARALLIGIPTPPAGPGTAFYRRATADTRLETIRRILARHGVDTQPEPVATLALFPLDSTG